MPFYASGWQGTGTTRTDSFKPIVVASYAGKWSAIDLRPAPNSTDGYALVWTETAVSPVPTGAWLLAAGADSVLTSTIRNRINTLVGLSLPSGTTFRQAVRTLMTSHATGPAKGRWRPVVADALGRLQLVLGDLVDEWVG